MPDAEIRLVVGYLAERHDVRVEVAVKLGAEGDDAAPVWIAAGLARRRIGVGDVFRDDAHAAGFRAHPGRGNRDRFDEIHHGSWSPCAAREARQ